MTRSLQYLAGLACLLLLGSLFSAGTAVALSRLALTAAIGLDPQAQPDTLSGKIALHWEEAQAEVCLYLPYHNERSRYSYNPLKHFDPLAARSSAISRAEGHTELMLTPSSGLEHSQLTASVVRLRFAQARKTLAYRFTTRLAASFKQGRKDFFFEGFYPTPLRHCPGPHDKAEELDVMLLPTELSAELTPPRGWQLVGPGMEASDGQPRVALQVRGRSLAFALAPHYHHSYTDTPQGRVNFYTLDRSDYFEKIESTLVAALAAHARWLGPLPYRSLTLVESRSYQRAGLPGIIAFNRPQQFLFDYLQTNMLNWQHWALSALLVAQWYGGAIGASHKADEWLLAGINDFVNLEFLRSHHKRYNLFNSFDKDFGFLAVDYLQLQEATASLLHRAEPTSPLTDPALVSSQGFREQSPLLFVKHALAMRYLKSLLGSEQFAALLRRFTSARLFTEVAPADFFAALEQGSAQAHGHSHLASQHLRQWWTHLGWSDLSLVDFDKEKLASGEWLATATYKDRGGYRLPVQVGFRTRDGYQYLVPGGEPDGEGLHKAYAMTRLEPVEVTIDPQHHVFDPDRFDNSSRQPQLHFFPGTASTLSDADYTAVWLPYAFRRPGQSFSLALQGALFRYINSGVFLKVELSPADRRGAYHLRYRHLFNSLPQLSAEFSLTQSYEGARTSAFTIQQSPLMGLGPYQLQLGSTLRLRQQLGVRASHHPTVALQAKVYPAASSACQLVLTGEHEESLNLGPAPYQYRRQKGQASALCNVAKNYDLHLRWFGGLSRAYGDSPLPDAARFRINDLAEAGVRVDEKSLTPATGLHSLGLDFFLPMALPLPANSLILSKQVRLRTFFDWGRATSPALAAHTYKAAGLGISLPLGGDMTGVGSLTLSRLSLLGVFFTQVDQHRSRRPHLLLDLTGEL